MFQWSWLGFLKVKLKLRVNAPPTLKHPVGGKKRNIKCDSHRGNEEVANLLASVPLCDTGSQSNLEHAVALSDLPHTEENGSDLPPAQDARLSLQQWSLVLL